MSPEAIITLSVIGLAMILFITEWVAVDVVAIGIMVVLVVTGVISAEQSLLGFANNATLTVAAMFVLSSALIKTNILEQIGPIMTRLLNRGYTASITGLGVVVGTLSAFVNNTPVVATFIPIVSKSARRVNLPPSRFLIPLSFVAMFGGTCTLIGTSTNLLVSGISEDQGYGAFSMFLLTPLGLLFALAGVLYLIFFGKKLVPERSEMSEEDDPQKLDRFLTEVRYEGEGGSDKTLRKVLEHENTRLKVLEVKRGDQYFEEPDEDFELQKSDVMLVKGNLKKIKGILKSSKINIVGSMIEKEYPDKSTKIIEIVLLPHAELDRRKLKEINFEKKYNANVIGIRQKGKSNFDDFREKVLTAGDVLLLQTNDEGYQQFVEQQRARESNFLILNETHIGNLKKKDLTIAASTIVGVIALASLGITPIVIAALGGIVVLNLTRVISMEEAYKAIDWQVIFLLAGALSLEKAMRESGVSEMIGDFLVHQAGEQYGPVVVLSLLYALTTLITGIISNNAAAALLAPISITIAQGMGIDPIPFLVAIAFAGSASFFTPVGYQTNTMVYSAGNYKFRDFLKVGTPLNFIFWIMATFLIPVLYPF